MKTEDLIQALARQAGAQEPDVERRFGAAEAAGIAVAVALFIAILGPRADIAEAVQTPWYLLKLALMACLALLTYPIVTALARPGASVPAKRLFIAALALAGAVAADLAFVGAGGAVSRLIGRNAVDCMVLIPVLAAGPLVAALVALRHGAPTRPGLAGAAAGLFSGAVGGLLYGIFCPDDSPLFIAVWYTIAIAAVTALGVIGGRLTLRW